MHKLPVFALGVVSMLSLLFLFIAGNAAITGNLINPYEPFDVQPTFYPQSLATFPNFQWPIALTEAPTPGITPLQDALTPSVMLFLVDRIPAPGYLYNVIPLNKESIHTFSGFFGYYDEDPTAYLQGYLCAYAYKVVNAPLQCERVQLAYNPDGTVSFARGYAPGEYIAYQAVGTDFGAVFVLVNQQYGVLATSPVAFLRFVSP